MTVYKENVNRYNMIVLEEDNAMENKPLYLSIFKREIEKFDTAEQIRLIEEYYKEMIGHEIKITHYFGFSKPVCIIRECGHTDMFDSVAYLFGEPECDLCRQQRIITQKIKDANLKVLAIDQKAHDIVLKCSKGHPAYQKSYKQILADDLECPRCLKETKTK